MKTEITGYEADALLFAFDKYYETDSTGRVPRGQHGHSREKLQALRERLMAIHEHPKGK